MTEQTTHHPSSGDTFIFNFNHILNVVVADIEFCQFIICGQTGLTVLSAATRDDSFQIYIRLQNRFDGIPCSDFCRRKKIENEIAIRRMGKCIIYLGNGTVNQTIKITNWWINLKKKNRKFAGSLQGKYFVWKLRAKQELNPFISIHKLIACSVWIVTFVRTFNANNQIV